MGERCVRLRQRAPTCRAAQEAAKEEREKAAPKKAAAPKPAEAGERVRPAEKCDEVSRRVKDGRVRPRHKRPMESGDKAAAKSKMVASRHDGALPRWRMRSTTTMVPTTAASTVIPRAYTNGNKKISIPTAIMLTVRCCLEATIPAHTIVLIAAMASMS